MAHPVRHNSTLSSQQSQVIAALLSGASVSAAAELAGVHRSTVHNWRLCDPLFAQELARARECHASEVRSQLEALASDALSTLRGILTSTRVSDSVRLKAALAVLRSMPAAAQHQADPDAPELPVEPNCLAPDPPDAFPPAFEQSNPIAPQTAVPRSAPCPCGSGLKFKRCCGQSAPPHLNFAAPAA